MKAFFTCAVVTCMIAGCASTEVTTSNPTEHQSPVETINDQPQTSVAGGGTLMPGAYGSRRLQTGQFTGRERTNDQVGQRPTLPREADARELARSEDTGGELGTGAGTLGQSGIVPDRTVSTETLMETTAVPATVPAHVAVTPPGEEIGQEVETEAIGAPPGGISGEGSVTNAIPSEESRPE